MKTPRNPLQKGPEPGRATFLLEIWIAALDADLGVCVYTNHRHKLLNELYLVRQQSGVAALQALMILVPKAEAELWIVHQNADEKAWVLLNGGKHE